MAATKTTPAARPAAPLSPRGERTRTRLVEAARQLFERDGFVNARITEIAARAGTAVGSFYTYFADKPAIFLAVVDLVDQELTDPVARDVTDPLARVAAGNLAYVRKYRKNARILAALQHRTFEDPALHDLRQRARLRWIDRAERLIRRLQEDGVASRELSARFTATALSGMVHSFCYETFAFGGRQLMKEEEIAQGLTALWLRALGVGTAAKSSASGKKRGAA
jgi:AcrR family transcriptional regulator